MPRLTTPFNSQITYFNDMIGQANFINNPNIPSPDLAPRKDIDNPPTIDPPVSSSLQLQPLVFIKAGNGKECPPLSNEENKGKLEGGIITSKIKNAYGGFVKGNIQYISRLEIAYDNFLSNIKTLSTALVGDSYRSFDVQKTAYEAFIANGKKGPNKASPCKGYHVAGQAIDLNQGGSYIGINGKKISFVDDIRSHGLLYKTLYDAGLRRVGNEWWHWSIGETDFEINKKFIAYPGSPADFDNYTIYPPQPIPPNTSPTNID